MSRATVRTSRQPVNLSTVRTIACLLKAESSDSRLHRALDNAVEDFEARLAFTLRGDTLEAQSKTDPSRYYTVTLTSCGCRGFEKGLRCRHIARLMILRVLVTIESTAASVILHAPQIPAPQPQPRGIQLNVRVEVIEAGAAIWRERTQGMDQRELEATLFGDLN